MTMQQVKLSEGKWAEELQVGSRTRRVLASESDPLWVWGRPDTVHHEAGGGGGVQILKGPNTALHESERGLLVSGLILPLVSLGGRVLLVFHKKHVLWAS